VLPNSSTHLPWAQPAQARDRVAVGRSAANHFPSTNAADLIVPPDLAGPAEVIKVAHEVAVGSTTSLQLKSAANAQRTTVTRVAQQSPPPVEEDPAAIFDGALDELLPGGDPTAELAAPSSPPADEPTPAPTPAEPSPEAMPVPAESPAEDFADPDWPTDVPTELEDLDENLVEPQPLPSLNGEVEEPPGTPPSVPDQSFPADDERMFVPPEFGRAFDCESEVQIFQQAWDELRHKPLSSISLDITPAIRPNEPRESAEREQQIVQSAVSRPWRDKHGRILAEGRLRGFREAHVLIEEESGQVHPVSWYDLGNDDLCYVSSLWELPKEFSPSSDDFEDRNWTMLTFTWTASALCHKPLYLEDVQLERYGHSAGPVGQAMLSGVHFFGNIFLLPYHMGLNPPNECQYALGYYRPGSCAPWLLPAYPLSARGARWEAAVLIGGLLLLP
jgi:hypothetical protein